MQSAASNSMLNYSVQDITDGWMAFLKVLATNYGLKFVIGERVPPATDGKTIYLPALPMVLTADDLDLFKGDGFHEIGHIIYSNIPFFQAFAKQHGNFGRFLLNALDDVFMERKQAANERQAEYYLRRSAQVMFERKQFRDGSASPAEAVGCYSLCFLSAQVWSEYVPPLEEVTANFNKHFGEHADTVREHLDDVLLSEFPSVQSTDHAGALALRIMAMLQALGHEDEQKRNQPSNTSPKSNEGETSNSSNGGANQPGDKKEQSDKSKGEGGAGKEGQQGSGGNDSKNASKADGSGRSLKEIVDEILQDKSLGEGEVFDRREAVQGLSDSVARGKNPEYKGQSVVPKMVVDGKTPKPGKPGTGVAGGAGVGEVVDGIAVCRPDASEAKEMVQRLGARPQVLAHRLQALLMQQEEAEAISAPRGQLGQAHLYRFGLGDVRIFTQQEELERPTTAVSLVLDLSSSTQDAIDKKFAQGEKDQFMATKQPSTLRSILESAVLLEKVLDQIGTPREILGFAPRVGELMSMVRSFGEDHQTAMARLGGLRRIAGGNQTPIGEAVFHAGRRLVSQATNRKVMFVLTDGVPSNVTKAVEMTQYFQKAGVRVVYLVIGSSVQTDWLVKAGIPHAVAATSADVSPILLREAKSLLG